MAVQKGAIDYQEFMTLQRSLSSGLAPERFFQLTLDLISRVNVFEELVKAADWAERETNDILADTKTMADIAEAKSELRPYGQHGDNEEAFLTDYFKRVADKDLPKLGDITQDS
jgi:hypothetical protein